MLAFLKKNSYLIFRLILNQIGMTIFGLMTSMAAAAVDRAIEGGGEIRRTCMIWVSVFSILFYMFINYTALKEEGQRDKIRCDAGREQRTPMRGLIIALCASLPNLIMAALIFIFGLLGSESGPALEWAGGACGSVKVLASILQAMYWGVMLGWSGVQTIAEIPPFVFAIIPLPTILCGFISYYFGIIDVSLGRYIKKFFTPAGK